MVAATKAEIRLGLGRRILMTEMMPAGTELRPDSPKPIPFVPPLTGVGGALSRGSVSQSEAGGECPGQWGGGESARPFSGSTTGGQTAAGEWGFAKKSSPKRS